MYAEGLEGEFGEVCGGEDGWGVEIGEDLRKEWMGEIFSA